MNFYIICLFKFIAFPMITIRTIFLCNIYGFSPVYLSAYMCCIFLFWLFFLKTILNVYLLYFWVAAPPSSPPNSTLESPSPHYPFPFSSEKKKSPLGITWPWYIKSQQDQVHPPQRQASCGEGNPMAGKRVRDNSCSIVKEPTWGPSSYLPHMHSEGA